MSMSVDDGINMEESSDSKSTRKHRAVGAQSSTEKWVESEVVSLIHCQVASNVSFFSWSFSFVIVLPFAFSESMESILSGFFIQLILY